MANSEGGLRATKSVGRFDQQKWEDTLAAYLRFLNEHNRRPSQYSEGDAEISLNKWFTNQKSKFKLGKVPPERIAVLDQKLPGWSKRERPRPSWESMLDRTVKFKSGNNRLPMHGGRLKDEKFLFDWLTAQRSSRAQVRSRLYQNRVLALDTKLPGWREVNTGFHLQEAWAGKLQSLEQFVADHGRFPKALLNPTLPESRMASWVSVQKTQFKKGILHTDRVAALNERVPGWNTVLRKSRTAA